MPGWEREKIHLTTSPGHHNQEQGSTEQAATHDMLRNPLLRCHSPASRNAIKALALSITSAVTQPGTRSRAGSSRADAPHTLSNTPAWKPLPGADIPTTTQRDRVPAKKASSSVFAVGMSRHTRPRAKTASMETTDLLTTSPKTKPLQSGRLRRVSEAQTPRDSHNKDTAECHPATPITTRSRAARHPMAKSKTVKNPARSVSQPATFREPHATKRPIPEGRSVPCAPSRSPWVVWPPVLLVFNSNSCLFQVPRVFPKSRMCNLSQ